MTLSQPASAVPPERDVSVVIPAWGDYAGDLLRESLASVRAQDLAAHLIVVDNASEPALSELSGVELIRSPERLSVGAARNLGLERVQTPYVMFWDADDLMLPGTLRLLRDHLAADPGVVLASAAILEGDPPHPHHWPRPWTRPLTRHRSAWAFFHSVWSIFPTNGATMMRAAAARECGGFADANSGEDWVLSVSLAYRGRIVLDPTPGLLYRRHATSLLATGTSYSQLIRNAAAVRERIRHDRGIPRWTKGLLPVTALLQVMAIYWVHPLVSRTRRSSA